MVSKYIGDTILRQSSEIIPKYYAIRDYLVSDNCVIEGRMRDLTFVKEACQYVGIILLACGAAGWLILNKKSMI